MSKDSGSYENQCQYLKIIIDSLIMCISVGQKPIKEFVIIFLKKVISVWEKWINRR